jgi:hypothetical protein
MKIHTKITAVAAADAWTAASNSTDVRVWYTVNCPNGPSGGSSRHVYPPSGHWGPAAPTRTARSAFT